MTPYNRELQPFDRRQLYFYRLIGSLPADDINLHACAHLYASDRNSLFIVMNNLDVGEIFTHAASLSHTVVFHSGAKDILMTGGGGDRLWFCKEDWTTRAAGGRGIHQSRIVGPNGEHVASSWQEGVVRIGKDQEESLRWMKRKAVKTGETKL